MTHQSRDYPYSYKSHDGNQARFGILGSIVLTIDWYLSEEGRKWTEECTSGEYLNWIEKNYKERN